jgi:hypothetical protein
LTQIPLTKELLEAISRLPKAKRTKVMALVGKAEYDKCQADPLYWLDSAQHVATAEWPGGLPYVFTKDPHKVYRCHICDGEVNEESRVTHLEIVHKLPHTNLHMLREQFTLLPAIRPFPMLEYIVPMVRAWEQAQYYAVEKSRDMSCTWLLVALFTWDAMFHGGRQHIFQSEDAFKTLELVQRAAVIYKNTPSFLRSVIGEASFSKGTTKAGELYFTDVDSEILGLPAGPDQIRQFHPSGIFSDECAFQTEAAATFAAIKPAIMQGGRYSAISSANRSWFELLVSDRTDD